MLQPRARNRTPTQAAPLSGVHADPDTLTRIMAETRTSEEHRTGEFDHDKHPRFHEERD
jgi:cytochrome c oxidase subunit 1